MRQCCGMTPDPSAESGARAALPHADDVPGRVAESRYPEVALRVGRGDDLASFCDDLVERGVDALDVDVGKKAGLSCDREVGHEVADDVTGRILKARMVWVTVQAPAEDAAVEGGRSSWLRSGDAEIRHATNSGDTRLHLLRWHLFIIPKPTVASIGREAAASAEPSEATLVAWANVQQ